jgi:hypothetical protein
LTLIFSRKFFALAMLRPEGITQEVWDCLDNDGKAQVSAALNIPIDPILLATPQIHNVVRDGPHSRPYEQGDGEDGRQTRRGRQRSVIVATRRKRKNIDSILTDGKLPISTGE